LFFRFKNWNNCFNLNISYLNFINDSTNLDENNSSFLDGDLIINNLKKWKNISINNNTVTQYNGYYNKTISNYKNDSITFLIGLGNGSEFFNESYTLNKIENNKYEIKFDKPFDKTDKIVSINFKNNKINTENINLIINTYSIINIGAFNNWRRGSKTTRPACQTHELGYWCESPEGGPPALMAGQTTVRGEGSEELAEVWVIRIFLCYT
jgi:hypothetical protein